MQYVEWNAAWETGLVRADHHHKLLCFVINDMAASLACPESGVQPLARAASSFLSLAYHHLGKLDADHSESDLAGEMQRLDALFLAVCRASARGDEAWFDVLRLMMRWLLDHLSAAGSLSAQASTLPAPS